MVTRRKSTRGTDEAAAIGLHDGGILTLSYWDVWMLLVVEDEFKDDVDAMAAYFAPLVSTGSSAGMDAERKLAHLRDLQERLVNAEVCVGDLLSAIDEKLTSRTSRDRARRKVLCQGDLCYEWSVPMQRPPSVVHRGV